MTGFVGAQHEFHDAAFVRGWADRFVPTEPRLQLFDMILDQIRRPNIPNTHVVELGATLDVDLELRQRCT